MFDVLSWKAIPRTNIGETFYGSSETALKESISALVILMPMHTSK
jgi:hypothetical protein